jgi:hypothetical protein
MTPVIALLASALALACTSVQAAAPQAEPLSFNRDVRPILSENCFACHGFDPKHREAGLRLDTFEGATADRNGSIGIVPGDPAKSAVWERIRSTDPDVVMPPPKSHRNTLAPKQQEILRQWIEQGAQYEPHWSFQAPERDPSPADHKELTDSACNYLPSQPPKHSFVASLSTSPDCRRRSRKSMRSPRHQQSIRTRLSPNWSIACCRVPTTVNAGDAGGSIRPDMLTATATQSMLPDRSGNSATGSSTR